MAITVRAYLDGVLVGTVSGIASLPSDVNFDTSTWPDGLWTLTVTQQVDGEAESLPSTGVTLAINNQAPIFTAQPSVQTLGDTYVIVGYSWSDAENDDALIEYSINNGSTWSTAKASESPGSGKTYQINGLTEQTSYNIRLRLIDSADGDITTSNLLAITTNETINAAPVFTAQPTRSSRTYNSFTVGYGWSDAEGNAALVEYSTDNGSTWFTAKASEAQGSGKTYQITGLTESTQYNFKLRLTDLVGGGSVTSNTLTDSTVANAAPVFTAQPSFQAATTDSITVGYGWSDAESNNALVEYSTNNGSTYSTLSASQSPGSGKTYQITGLSENTAYNIRIRLTDLSGTGVTVSNTLNASTSAVGGPFFTELFNNLTAWSANTGRSDTFPTIDAGRVKLNAVSPAACGAEHSYGQTVNSHFITWDMQCNDATGGLGGRLYIQRPGATSLTDDSIAITFSTLVKAGRYINGTYTLMADNPFLDAGDTGSHTYVAEINTTAGTVTVWKNGLVVHHSIDSAIVGWDFDKVSIFFAGSGGGALSCWMDNFSIETGLYGGSMVVYSDLFNTVGNWEFDPLQPANFPSVVSNRFFFAGSELDACLLTLPASLKSCTVQFDVQFESGTTQDFRLYFQEHGSTGATNNSVGFSFPTDLIRLLRYDDGTVATWNAARTMDTSNHTYKLTIDRETGDLKLYIDGVLKVTQNDATHTYFSKITFYCASATAGCGAYLDNLTITAGVV